MRQIACPPSQQNNCPAPRSPAPTPETTAPTPGPVWEPVCRECTLSNRWEFFLFPFENARACNQETGAADLCSASPQSSLEPRCRMKPLSNLVCSASGVVRFCAVWGRRGGRWLSEPRLQLEVVTRASGRGFLQAAVCATKDSGAAVAKGAPTGLCGVGKQCPDFRSLTPALSRRRRALPSWRRNLD